MPRTPRGAITLGEEQPRTPRHRGSWPGWSSSCSAVVGTAAVLGVRHLRGLVSGEQCLVTASGSTFCWAPDQASNAAAITAIAVQRGMPPRAATIAIATAMQESKVRNVKFGDRDSLGLFQQRPSQGWGTAEQILDPEYSTNKFYDALEKIKGYRAMDIAAGGTEGAAVGGRRGVRPARGPGPGDGVGAVGPDPRRHGVRARGPADAGDPAEVAALVEKDFGISASEGKDTVNVAGRSADLAWAVGSWAVARAADTGATRVVVGDREWRRGMQDSALAWHTVDAGLGADPRTVTIHLA